MTERRDLQQITTHQHCRQYPLDGYLAMNICKMTARQISRIRDMSLSELRKQEYVSREEFAYITGRTFKATGNYLDRNEDLVYRSMQHLTPHTRSVLRNSNITGRQSLITRHPSRRKNSKQSESCGASRKHTEN